MKGPFYGGIIASRMLAYSGLSIDPTDIKFSDSKLDLHSMKLHHFVTRSSTIDNIFYELLFASNSERLVRLPAPLLFNHDAREGWAFEEKELDAYLESQEGHEEHTTE